MDRIKGFASTYFNPLPSLAKIIYKAALGSFIKTENLDSNNFLKNGLVNVKVDPDKVNAMLLGVPFKVVEGKISELKVSIENTASKVEVVMGKVELIAYLDDHSQFRFGESAGGNYVEASALGFASELEEETKSSGGFLEKLLTCFELGVTISSIEIELRTERYVRKSSKIMLSIGKIDARKLKQKSDSTIHSFSVSIGTLEGRFQQIGEHSAQKLFAFERLTRRGEPTMTTQALILAVDVLKAPGQESLRKTVVRGDLASLQCILTLLNSIDIFKVIDKLGLFALRKKYLDEGIGEILKFFKMHENEEAMMDVDEEGMGKEVFESFRTSAIFQSLYQSCKFDSNLHKGMIAGLESKNEGPNSIHSKSQEFLDNIKTGFQDSGLDVEFQWQGLFVGMLKVPRFDTDNVFAWISDLGKEEPFNFSSTLYSHFLLRSENVKLTYIDSQKDKILTFGSLEVVDCILNEQPKQGSAPIDMGSGNRVDIQGLDSDSMNMSMSFTNADLFQSFIKFDDSHPLEYCKEKVMLKLVPVPIEGSLSKPPVIKVKLDLGSIPQIEIFIHKILIDFDLESFKLMADRKAMYEEIMQICQLVVAEKKRGESESQMAHEARLLFDGVTAFSLQQMLAGLTELYKALQIDNVKEQLTREWKIVLPHTLTQAQSMKIDLHITHFEAKVGGRIDPEAGKSSYMILKGGSMNVLMQKLILISWKQPIEIATETELGRHVVLKVTGEKENVVGIDDKNMVVKISAVEVMISPAIFEGILLLTQFVGSKLDRLEFNHQKYQIVKSLTTLFELQTQSYLLYQEEGQVNRMVKQIDSLIYQAPPLVEKAYIYLGHIDLQIFDEDITRDIIESSIAQRRRMLDDYDDFVVVDEQSNQRSIREDLHDDIEKKEKILREKNEVIHLELKPLMVKLELGPKPSMMLLIHTIMLQDGLTYISMKKDRLRYPTHFCELYSINYNQPTFDANLSKKFEIKQCLSSFREILKRFKKEKPFLQITQYIDIDEDLNRTVQKMNIDVSSIVFRVSMKTSKEIFACLIRIIDSTLMRLDNISVLFQKLREANTTDEMKLYRRKQSIKNQSMNQMKAQETGSAISINIDSVYLDIFYEGSYRLLFKITSTEISMSDNPRLNQPTQVECTKLIMAFTTSDEHTRKKGVEQMEDKATYFKVLSLQSMVVKMTQPIDQGVPTTDIQVILPTKNKRNLLLMIDLDFLSVLLELLRTFSSLLSHAKSKTQFIFKDFNEYIDKQPEVPLRKEKEFEEAGVHEAEKLAVLKQFMIFSDNLMSTDFQDDVPDEEKVQELSDDDLNTIERKLRSAIGFLTDMFFDKFADKASNLNLKVYLDKVTVNIYQNFDFHSHSYISLKLGRVSGVVNINSTSSETSRKSERTLSTTSAILSARSIKIVDNTTGSMFKYLLKIPHHSLNMFFRSREVSEKYLKETINSIKPTYVVERFMDKIAFTLMLNPIQIFIDDKSVASLKTFTEKLITILKFNQQEDNLVISEKKEAGKAPPEQGQEIIVDFIYIGDIRLGLIARSATNVSLANVIPDINFDLGDQYKEYREPLTSDEIMTDIINTIKSELSYKNILTLNKANIPLLSSFYTLWDSVNLIYSAVSNGNGNQLVMGVRKIVILLLVSCLKTSQFGFKTVGDITNFFSKAAFNSKLLNFDRIYKGIEGWVNKLSGTKSSLK